jgi:hypothetical protein
MGNATSGTGYWQSENSSDDWPTWSFYDAGRRKTLSMVPSMMHEFGVMRILCCGIRV